MAKFRDKNSKLIEVLKETGIVGLSCKKTGINRSTFYRWARDIPDFKIAADTALVEGKENTCDMAKSMLLKKVKDGSMDAIKYFLSNNDLQYIQKRTVFVEPMTSEDRRLVETIRKRQAAMREEKKEEAEYKRDPVLEEIMKKLSPEEQDFLLDTLDEEMRKISHGLF